MEMFAYASPVPRQDRLAAPYVCIPRGFDTFPTPITDQTRAYKAHYPAR